LQRHLSTRRQLRCHQSGEKLKIACQQESASHLSQQENRVESVESSRVESSQPLRQLHKHAYT
jgi:hypothetical protein